jgi:hypothetical protein
MHHAPFGCPFPRNSSGNFVTDLCGLPLRPSGWSCLV